MNPPIGLGSVRGRSVPWYWT